MNLPAKRFVVAQSWWLASELIRRHPELRLIETHPGGGQYDCLTLLAVTRRERRTILDLNRAGRMHGCDPERFEPIEWSEAYEAQNAHELVRRLEAMAGLAPPSATPVSRPATLVYRVAARVLAALVNERVEWDVRNTYLDTSGHGAGPTNLIAGFPAAVTAAEHRRPDDIFGNALYRFWALTRGSEPVAVLDVDGVVYLSHETYSLPELYVSNGRRLTPTVAQALGSVLP